jgi:hypothetical protein
MSISTIAETNCNSLPLPAVSSPNLDQTGRILAILGVATGGPPRVDDETLARYYAYLSANMSLRFTAYYPQPMNAQEKTQFCCSVLELLDPTQHLGDEFDGIFCKTRKGKYEINLPLNELEIPQDSPNFQLIEDYWYWFWNWR